MPTSDDFSGGTLDSIWSLEGPGGSVSLGTDGTEAYAELVVPDGDFDAFNQNNSVRLLQAATDEDFTLETRFLSTPSKAHQIQGILVQQDEDNWIRFDVYSSNSRISIFAGTTVNGDTDPVINQKLPFGAQPNYLQVVRTGDTWELLYSEDGTNWTSAVTFDHALTVNHVGPFAGATSQAGGYTAQVDYFFDSNAPIANEDGTVAPPANTPPAVTDDAANTDADTPVVLNTADLLGNDSDADGDALTFDSFTQPANGTLVDNGDGTLTYTPNAGFTGDDSFTYTVSDGTDTATGNVTVSVSSPAPGNTPPVVTDDAASTDIDAPVVLNVADLLGNDSDADGDTLTLDSFAQPANGTVVDNGDGTLTYTPNAGFTGDDSFTYTVSDGTDTASGSVTVSVSDPGAGSGGGGGTAEVISDDFSAATLDSIWSLEGPGGSVSLGTDGTEAYAELVVPDGDFDVFNQNNSVRLLQDAPNEDFILETRFLSTPSKAYQIQGILVEQDADNWIRFDVYSSNSRISIFAGTTVNGDTDPVINQRLPFGTEPNYLQVVRTGDTWELLYSEDGTNWISATTFNHALTVNHVGPFAGATTQAGGYTAQVDYFFNGAAPITDEDGTVAPPANTPPVATDDVAATDADTPVVLNTADLLSNDSDADGDALTFDSFAQPANGTLVDNGDGTLTYTPNAGFTGDDSFTYTVTDGTDTANATVTIGVNAAGGGNTPPVAVNDNRTTDISTPVVLSVAALLANDSDADGDTLTLDSFAQPANGTLVDNGDGTLTYTPNAGFTGDDSFTYTVTDGTDTANATVTIGVSDPGSGNTPPVVTDDTASTDIDAPVVLNVADLLANDSDADGDALTLDSFTQPANGTLVDNGDGTLTYTPNAGFTGDDSFTYTVTDGTDTGSGSVTVSVSDPGATAEVISDDFSGGTLDSIWSLEGPGGSVSLGVAGTDAFAELVVPDGDFDVFNQNNSVRLLQDAPNEDFTLETRFLSTPSKAHQIQGILVEQDADNWIRFDVYSSNSSISIFAGTTVNGDTDAVINQRLPAGTQPNYLQVVRTGDTWELLYSEDGANWISATTFNHALTVNHVGPFAGATTQAGGYTAQVDYFFNGAAPITDEDGTVIPPNTPPVVTDDVAATDADTPLVLNTATLLANDSDADGDALTFDSFAQPANGTLVDNGDGTLTYTPNAGFTGDDSFTYTVTDGTDTATGSVTVSVGDPGPANTPPVAANDTGATDVDTPVVLSVAALLANDSDADGDTLTLQSFAQPANGTLVDNGDGTLTYTPNAGFTGDDSFTYTVSDGTDTANATVTVSVADPSSGFATTVVDTNMPAGHVVEAADFDGDGDLDLVATSEDANAVAWYENNGGLNFTRHDIDTNLAGAYPASVADLDQDGDVDVLVGGFAADLLVWYENDGAGGFTFHQIDSLPLVNGPHSVIASDVDGDGDLDLLTTMQVRDRIDWYENDGNENFTRHVVDENALMIKHATPEDIDGDGDIDFVAASFEDNTIAVHINDGNQNFTKQVIDADALGAYYVDTADVDGDGDQDIVSASRNDNTIGLYLNDGAGGFTATVVDDNATAARSARFADIDGDGQIDIISGNRDDNEVAYYRNNGNGSFTKQVVATVNGAYGVSAADVDGDGFVDILSAGNGDGSVNVHRNLNAGPPPNSPPNAINDVAGTDIDAPVVLSIANLLSNDTDGNGDSLSFVGFAQPTNGTVVDNGDGTLTYTPNTGFIGDDSFTYTVTDGTDNDTATVTVTVTDPNANAIPVAVDDAAATDTDTPLLLSTAGLLANDTDADGDPLSFAGFAQPTNGTLVDNGDGTLTYTPNAGFTGDDSFTYTVSDGTDTANATVTVSVADPPPPSVAEIDVWYGNTQTFGSPGEAQRWVNILGNASGDVVSLTYSLNGGPEAALQVGPQDNRRLENPGDFNVQFDYDELDGSATDDLVTIRATLTDGSVISENVTIDYEAGSQWAKNYSVDWSQTTNIQDVVQVSDGLWGFDANGARPIETGYDRLLLLGDQSWDNYELTTTVTLNEIGGNNGGFLFGNLWNGHGTDPGVQLADDAFPGAAFFYKHQGELELYDWRKFGFVGEELVSLGANVEYNVKVRVEQTNIYDRQYSIKIWEEGQTEPVDWLLQGIDTSFLSGPTTGSIYLAAHNSDVTFGNINVTEITGSDVISANDASETLIAVDGGTGVGEIDAFAGGGGADVFVFGDASGVFYDDGDDSTSGEEDFGYIYDFESGSDQIQLSGSEADYELAAAPATLASGTGIYLTNGTGGPNELVGVIEGVSGLSLTSDDFIYEPPAVA